MRIVVADGFRPFLEERENGAAGRIAAALRACGHEVETVRLPRGGDLTRTALATRLTDVSDAGELLVAVGPPAHLLRHPRKLVWCEDGEFTSSGHPTDGDRSAFDEARAVIAASTAARALVREWWAGEVGLLPTAPVGDSTAEPDRRLVAALLA